MTAICFLFVKCKNIHSDVNFSVSQDGLFILKKVGHGVPQHGSPLWYSRSSRAVHILFVIRKALVCFLCVALILDVCSFAFAVFRTFGIFGFELGMIFMFYINLDFNVCLFNEVYEN